MKRNRLTRGHGEKVVQQGSVGERAKAFGNRPESSVRTVSSSSFQHHIFTFLN